jgi:hypothetical protein
MSSDEERFDGMLFTLAQQHQGGVVDVLDTLFSFLARKTDFYTGGPKGQAMNMVVEKFKKYEHVAQEKFEKEKAEREEADRARKERLRKKKEEEERELAQSRKIVEVDEAEAKRILDEENAKKNAPVVSEKTPADTNGSDKKTAENGGEEEDEADKNKLKPNSGNGADLDSYHWSQTLQEIDVKFTIFPKKKGSVLLKS